MCTAPLPDQNIGRSTPINDYALIGACHSAALVSREGSIDWLCQPRFDSPALFVALLDTDMGIFSDSARWGISDRTTHLPEINLLEAIFHCPDGVVARRNAMPVRSKTGKRKSLAPEHEIVREVVGIDGTVARCCRRRIAGDHNSNLYSFLGRLPVASFSAG